MTWNVGSTPLTDSQAIAGLIDRQRRDQEMLFRAFTNGKNKNFRLDWLPEWEMNTILLSSRDLRRNQG